jgi:hypothetical protein
MTKYSRIKREKMNVLATKALKGELKQILKSDKIMIPQIFPLSCQLKKILFFQGSPSV